MLISKGYLDLRKRIAVLREQFLPAQFSPTSSYNQADLDGAAAFKLLVHSEVEYFLEAKVFDIANRALANWQNKGICSRSLLAILAFYPSGLAITTNTLTTKSNRNLDLGIKESTSNFNGYARARNNGVRTINVLSLLLPVGINEVDIDPDWLAAIDSFGRDRGGTAHKPDRVNVLTVPDGIYKDVSYILDGLLDIDVKLNHLLFGESNYSTVDTESF